MPLGIIQGPYCYENLGRNFDMPLYQDPEIFFLLNILQHMATDRASLLNLVSRIIT